jgi:hypothetical protein
VADVPGVFVIDGLVNVGVGAGADEGQQLLVVNGLRCGPPLHGNVWMKVLKLFHLLFAERGSLRRLEEPIADRGVWQGGNVFRVQPIVPLRTSHRVR